MMPAAPIVWITWEDHRRTRGLCQFFALELHVLRTSVHGARRYFGLIIRTWQTLRATRPRVLIVQSPSIVLALVCVLWRGLFGYRLVMDAHNEAVIPFINPSAPIRWLTNFLLKAADLTIVTNAALSALVQARGGRPAVLPDRIPDAPRVAASAYRRETPEFLIAVIATFAPDEPIQNVLEAAARLPADVRFNITGDSGKLPLQLRRCASSNVRFCNFLAEDQYWQLLAAADLVIDLSLIDNCLVCGGYEALAAGTPLLLSSSEASRQHFRSAARYTDNSTESIVAEILAARRDSGKLRQNVASVRDELATEWLTAAAQLRARLEELSPGVR